MKRKDGKETVRQELIRNYTWFLKRRYEGKELENSLNNLKRKTTRSLLEFHNKFAGKLESPYYGMDKRQIRKAKRRAIV